MVSTKYFFQIIQKSHWQYNIILYSYSVQEELYNKRAATVTRKVLKCEDSGKVWGHG